MPRKNREKLSKPPEKAAEIIKVVRLLPANVELIDCYSLYKDLVGRDEHRFVSQYKNGEKPLIATKYDVEYETQFSDERIDWRLYESLNLEYEQFLFVDSSVLGFYLLKALEICLETLPTRFVEYVGLPEQNDKYLYQIAKESGFCSQHKLTSFDSFLEFGEKEPCVKDVLYYGYATCRAYERYSSVSELHTRLYNLAKIAQSKNSTDFLTKSVHDDLFIFDEVRVKIIDGRFDFETDDFTKAFRGVPVDRISLCDYCSRVFWANRVGMKGCTQECISALSTRRWREKKWSEKTTPEQRQQYKINKIKKENK